MNRAVTWLALLTMVVAVPGVAEAQWSKYNAPRYGYSMDVPPGTKITTKDREDGWGLLHGVCEGVELYGCAQLGRLYKAEQIEKFGVEVTGIPGKHWNQIDEGKTRNNWGWYKTVVAESDGKVAFGIYGIGPRGSYLLVLKTTSDDFRENRKAYDKWYESIKLHGGWKIFRAKEYGFTMLIPEKASPKTAEEGEWGALHGEHKGVNVYGLAKLGEQAKAADIEAVGVELTGIAASNWKHIDKGKDKRGWGWYQTVMASDGENTVVGIYGTGKKGSFLLLLGSTQSDYKAHKKQYDYWYEHVHLD